MQGYGRNENGYPVVLYSWNKAESDSAVIQVIDVKKR